VNPPIPTPIYRIVHIDNLETLLRRGGLHATNHTPIDGLPFRTIHNVSIQNVRQARSLPCGPGGTMHDYVPFYFGVLTPMLLQLKTGRITGYNEGQEPIIYLKSSVQVVREAGCGFVFSNGHGIAAFTEWFDNVERLDEVDWRIINERYWKDDVNDMDRQRRKQAEFLVHRFCPWALVREIGVQSREMQGRVEEVLGDIEPAMRPLVSVQRDWYYY